MAEKPVSSIYVASPPPIRKYSNNVKNRYEQYVASLEIPFIPVNTVNV